MLFVILTLISSCWQLFWANYDMHSVHYFCWCTHRTRKSLIIWHLCDYLTFMFCVYFLHTSYLTEWTFRLHRYWFCCRFRLACGSLRPTFLRCVPDCVLIGSAGMIFVPFSSVFLTCHDFISCSDKQFHFGKCCVCDYVCNYYPCMYSCILCSCSDWCWVEPT